MFFLLLLEIQDIKSGCSEVEVLIKSRWSLNKIQGEVWYIPPTQDCPEGWSLTVPSLGWRYNILFHRQFRWEWRFSQKGWRSVKTFTLSAGRSGKTFTLSAGQSGKTVTFDRDGLGKPSLSAKWSMKKNVIPPTQPRDSQTLTRVAQVGLEVYSRH